MNETTLTVESTDLTSQGKVLREISENFDMDLSLLSLAVKGTYWCKIHFTAGLSKEGSTTLAGVRDTV